MDTVVFDKFRQECSEKLPKVIDEILSMGKAEKLGAIGFITTDDFYGFYVSWDFGDDIEIDEYYDWENDDICEDTNFLYQPLVDIVDGCKEIDFCNPSDEKWDFALTLLTIMSEMIKQLPDDIFVKNNFKKENILFFSTMDTGDYMQEMLDESIKKFNTRDTLEAFECL